MSVCTIYRHRSRSSKNNILSTKLASCIFSASHNYQPLIVAHRYLTPYTNFIQASSQRCEEQWRLRSRSHLRSLLRSKIVRIFFSDFLFFSSRDTAARSNPLKSRVTLTWVAAERSHIVRPTRPEERSISEMPLYYDAPLLVTVWDITLPCTGNNALLRPSAAASLRAGSTFTEGG